MKKAFKFYFICWAAMFALFNLIVILLPKQTVVGDITYTKFGGTSWITCILFEALFLLQAYCTYKAFAKEKLTAIVYRIPVIRLSRACVIVTLLLGCLAMAVPRLPSDIPLLLCVFVVLCYMAAILKAEAAAEIVEETDEKVKARTAFIKTLTADAQSLAARAAAPEAKAACKKVCEALRYSDPVSNDALAEAESAIAQKLAAFSEAVTAGAENVPALAEELVALIGVRNNKCKAVK